MMIVPATEFSKNFGKYREIVQRETVAVTSHARITGYFLSRTEYEEYARLKELLPRAYAVEELPEETINAIRHTRMDATHDHLNALLDE